MPELPEVEVIRMGLSPRLLGKSLSRFWYSGKALRNPVAREAIACENGSRITAVSRRAKYLLFTLDTGNLLVFHLGMTGNLGIFPAGTPRRKHDHLEWRLEERQTERQGGTLLRYHDPRRFGSVTHITGSVEARQFFFRNCGVEPLSCECTVEYFQQYAKKRKIAVKTFLMTNQIVVGIGNIYASESLFAAGILPQKRACDITTPEWQRLTVSIKETLTAAIACGGSTISDFRNEKQQSGYFQMQFQVYGRGGRPCKRCGADIEKVVLGGRVSFFCPLCQR